MVLTPEMLRPELQDIGIFAESVATIVTTHERVARAYFEDGTISLAVPPLRALLEIMAHGVTAEGWTLDTPEFRDMFTREAVLASDWYAARLDAKQAAASGRATAGLAAIEKFVSTPGNEAPSARLRHAGPGGCRAGGGAAPVQPAVPRAAGRNGGQHAPVILSRTG